MAQTFNEKIKSGIQAREQRKTDIYALEKSLPKFLRASETVQGIISEYKSIAEAKKAAEEAEAKAKAEEQAKAIEDARKRQEYAQAQAKQLYGATTTQPIVGGEMPMYKKGGVAKMVTINVEKGELAVDPRTMKVIMDFNDMPKHPKGKDVINQKGNVKVPVGTIIIPADMRRDFLKAEPGQRIEMAAELIERQREGEEKEMEMEGEEMQQGQMPMQQGWVKVKVKV